MLGIIGFFAALFLIMMGSMRGYHIIILTVLASVTVIITNQMPFYDSFFASEESFMAGMTSFIGRYFVIFLLSAILAKYIESSGAAQSIANFILDKTGRDRPYLVLVAIFLFAAVLTLGGVNLFVAMFVLVPLSRNLLKSLDLSWKLMVTPYMMGVGSFTMTTMPGNPSIQNVIMSDYLGTSLTTVPVYSLILTTFLIAYSLWRMRVELNDSLAKGEGFEKRFDRDDQVSHDKLPCFIRAISPLACLFLTIIIGSFWQVDQLIIIALTLAVLLAIIVFRPYVDSNREVLNTSALNSVSSVMAPATTLGFGTVMANAPAFDTIMDGVQSLPLTPILSLILITAILQFVIGSASGVLSIVGEKFLPLYDLSAYNPGFVHRLLLTTPGFMPPHVGAYLSFLQVSGLTHQDSYRQVMISLNGGIALTVVLGYLLGLMIN